VSGGPARPAVFLDRDGTINREVDFLARPRELELLPGSAEAIARLNERGFAVVVVTNQSGIARGLLDEARLADIHARLEAALAEHGARLDRILFCPHHPSAGRPPYRRRCDCRKPAPGLLRRAIAELRLDPRASWVVGDSARDVQAGAALGIRGILVESGKEIGADVPPGTLVAPDLARAVDRVLADG